MPMFGTKSYGSESHRGYETNRYEESRHTGRDNLIAMPHAQKSVSVVVVEPIGFDEVQKMADYLRNNQPVVINFEIRITMCANVLWIYQWHHLCP